MHGRLSSFQKTLLQWDALHPYNAVHAVRLAGSPAIEQLEVTLSRALTARGVTGLSINRRQGTYRYRGSRSRAEVRMLPSGGDEPSAFTEEVERQLNAPFPSTDDEAFEPFRFFCAPGAETYWLGLTYFHPIADAESVVGLLRDLAHAVLGRCDPEALAPLDRYPRCPESLSVRRPLQHLRALATLPGTMWGARRACRAPLRDPTDQDNRIRSLSLGSDRLASMKAAGHAWGVTFNDLVVAALLQSLSPLCEKRRLAARRREIGLGVIVNLRNELGVRDRGPFGLMLGAFRVAHEVPQTMTFQALARAVGWQTRRAKRTRSYLATSGQLRLVRFLFLRFSYPRRLKFYLKHYPLWGGVTNMNLNALWPLPPDEGVLDYYRAVSTGPATPLVVSCTTVGNRINFGVSYRSSVFRESELEQVSRGFIGCLDQLPTK